MTTKKANCVGARGGSALRAFAAAYVASEYPAADVTPETPVAQPTAGDHGAANQEPPR